MKTTTNEPLDGYETALLRELRGVVQERAYLVSAHTSQSPDGPRLTSRPRRTLRWAVPLGIAAAGAVALTITQPFSGGTPAFAVEEQSGEVTVQINRLEGADGLEAALAEHGITAAVDYPEEGTRCSPDRFVAAPPGGSGTMTATASEAEVGTSFSLTLDPADYAGKTLVLESTWFGDQAWSVGVDTAHGEVGPCNPVPHDDPSPEQFAPGTGPGSDDSGD